MAAARYFQVVAVAARVTPAAAAAVIFQPVVQAALAGLAQALLVPVVWVVLNLEAICWQEPVYLWVAAAVAAREMMVNQQQAPMAAVLLSFTPVPLQPVVQGLYEYRPTATIQ